MTKSCGRLLPALLFCCDLICVVHDRTSGVFVFFLCWSLLVREPLPSAQAVSCLRFLSAVRHPSLSSGLPFRRDIPAGDRSHPSSVVIYFWMVSSTISSALRLVESVAESLSKVDINICKVELDTWVQCSDARHMRRQGYRGRTLKSGGVDKYSQYKVKLLKVCCPFRPVTFQVTQHVPNIL